MSKNEHRVHPHLLVGLNAALELSGLLALLGSGVSLPRLLGVDREEDQFRLVLLQPLWVLLRGLDRLVCAIFLLTPADLSSSRVKPRPRRCFRLYLSGGHWTTGRRDLTVLGATWLAFSTCAALLRKISTQSRLF